MPKSSILTTLKDVISYVTKRYMANLHLLAIQKDLSEVEKAYKDYLNTKDKKDLIFLFVLCLRIRHGNRMPWESTVKAVNKLIVSGIITQSFVDFEQLYGCVREILKGIYFAQGSLTVYDTSLTIGHLKRIYPKSKVYLNAGAWDGAEAIIGPKNVKPVMNIADWQKPGLFPGIDSMYIEDILCCFKIIFQKSAGGSVVTTKDVDSRITKLSRSVNISKLRARTDQYFHLTF